MAVKKPTAVKATATVKAKPIRTVTVHTECAPAGSSLTISLSSDGKVVLTVGDISVELIGSAVERMTG